MYLACNTRPDLAHATSMLSRFMSEPSDVHRETAKRVLRYVKGSMHVCLKYPGPNIQGVCNAVVTYGEADYAADVDKRRSTTGMVVTMNGCTVVWFSKLQTIVATSTTEAEFIAASTSVKEGLWLSKLMGEMNGVVSPVCLMCDNQSTVKLIKNHTSGERGRSKHIDIQFQAIRDRYQRGELIVQYVETSKQLADMFTKQLPTPAFESLMKHVTGNML